MLKSPTSFRNIARYYASSGNRECALINYQTAMDMDQNGTLIEYTNFLYGTGNEEDYAKCKAICERLPNNKDAVFRLAQMYRNGRGVTKDIGKSIELMEVAISLGHNGAKKELSVIKSQL